MEEADGGLSFDFESGLEATTAPTLNPANATQPPSTMAAAPLQGAAPGFGFLPQKPPERSNRNLKQTVCRHWLRGLCMKGDVCGYLHQLDRERMPICRFFAKYGVCAEPDCAYKHTEEEIKECNMYKLGFCPNGPDCRYRHQKMPGPFPPLEESLQKIQQRATFTNGPYPGRHSTYRHTFQHSQEEAQPWRQPSYSRGRANLLNTEQPHLQKPPQQQTIQPVTIDVLPNQSTYVSASHPLPEGTCRYFIVKSSNRENLGLSVERGMWATHRNNEAKLNEAFETSDHVILIFSVNETGHFQGCAKMTSKIGVAVGGGGWKYAHGTAHFGRNFRLKWLKLCELSFHKTRHLRNPFNENLPVKISRDCQELETSVGEQLASLLYLEPDSDLMAIAIEVELKLEQEKAHGAGSAQEVETKIVPFEDNEAQEDESNEEESSSQTASASQSRGGSSAGRGSMWGPQGVLGMGGRGRNMEFSMDTSGADSFGRGFAVSAGAGYFFPPYGAPCPRFGGPDFSSVRPRATMGFGPMDATIAAPGMIYTGRPPNPIFSHGGMGIMGPPGGSMMGGVRPGNMMGATRSPYMGASGATRRSSRFSGMPFRPPQSSGIARGRRGFTDQRLHRRNEQNLINEELVKGREAKSLMKTREDFINAETSDIDGEVESSVPFKPHQPHGNSYRNKMVENGDDSESEDEAPRRSRYGEGRRKRHGQEGQWNRHVIDGRIWAGGDADDLMH